MGLILNIETSSSICSVCLAKKGVLIDFKETKEANSHAKLLIVLIQNLLRENNISFSELDAIAVSSGPGSYTGLRIGVSSAKGFCYSLNKPLISVPTLISLSEAIKQKVNGTTVHYMPVLDARRLDIYTAVYDCNGSEILKTLCATLDGEFEREISSLGDIYIGGNAIAKCKNFFTSSNIHFITDVDCDSKLMINISEAKYIQSEFDDPAYFEPFYLKGFLPKIKK